MGAKDLGHTQSMRPDQHTEVGRPDRAPSQAAVLQAGCNALAVHQLMRAFPPSISPHLCAADAARRMICEGLAELPVVDDAGRPIGVLSRSDLLEAYVDPALGGGASVKRLMVPYVLAVDTQAPLQLALALIAYEGVQGVLVIDATRRLVGTLNTLDLVRWMAQQTGADSS
jgi:CBS domain-containing protein